jgi:hypothetical protein
MALLFLVPPVQHPLPPLTIQKPGQGVQRGMGEWVARATQCLPSNPTHGGSWLQLVYTEQSPQTLIHLLCVQVNVHSSKHIYNILLPQKNLIILNTQSTIPILCRNFSSLLLDYCPKSLRQMSHSHARVWHKQKA